MGNVGHPNSGAPYLGMWSHYPGSEPVWRARNLSILGCHWLLFQPLIFACRFGASLIERLLLDSLDGALKGGRQLAWQQAKLCCTQWENSGTSAISHSLEMDHKWKSKTLYSFSSCRRSHQAWKIISMLSLLETCLFLLLASSPECIFIFELVSLKSLLWWPFKNWYV